MLPNNKFVNKSRFCGTTDGDGLALSVPKGWLTVAAKTARLSAVEWLGEMGRSSFQQRRLPGGRGYRAPGRSPKQLTYNAFVGTINERLCETDNTQVFSLK